MFCGSCGEKLDDSVKFCHKCGTVISMAQERVQVQPKAAPVAVQPQPVYQQPVSTVPSNQQQVVTRSKTSKSGVTSLIISSLAFIIGLISMSYMVEDGWFSPGYTDFLIGLVPLTFSCLLSSVFGIVAVYGKRDKLGLAGIIITYVNLVSFLIFCSTGFLNNSQW